MSNISKDFFATVKRNIKQGNFEKAEQVIDQQKMDESDWLILLKRLSRDIFKKAGFWQSSLCQKHIKYVLKSDLRNQYLEAYFAAAEHCNHALNQLLLEWSEHEFIYQATLWKAFTHDSFFESFEELRNTSDFFEFKVAEWFCMRTVLLRNSGEEAIDRDYWKRFSFDEIAMAFSLCHDYLKNSSSTMGNRAHLVSNEVALVDLLTPLMGLVADKEHSFKSNTALQKEWHRYCAGKKQLDVPLPEEYQLLFDLINRAFNRLSEQVVLDKYACGFIRMTQVSDDYFEFTETPKMTGFAFNDHKGGIEEMYFMDLDLKRLISSEKISKSRVDITSSLNAWKFYGFPDEFECAEGHIMVSKLLKVLRFFSVYKGPLENVKIGSNKADKRFTDRFGKNTALNYFKASDFIKKVAQYFKWPLEETTVLLDFLSQDLNSPHSLKQWHYRPFLRSGEYILWLGAFLKDRRWENLMINRIKTDKSDKLLKKVKEEAARNLECKVAQILDKAGFSTLSSKSIQLQSGERGEIDVLAYKDKHLFVCEVKSVLRSDDFRHAGVIENTRIEGEAVHQVKKAITYVSEYWASIKEMLGIDLAVELSQVTLVPLIVSDTYEAEHHLYEHNTRKISLLELYILCTNSKEQLFRYYQIHNRFTNGLNPDLKPEYEPEDYDLWNGSQEPQAATILECIDDNRLWKELLNVWKFISQTYQIKKPVFE